MLGYAAALIGKPEPSIDELADSDWIATAAAIGAPAPDHTVEMRGVDYVKAVQLCRRCWRKDRRPDHRPERLPSTLNGWLPSAILGTKVVDAAGDIRAHPTGDMA